MVRWKEPQVNYQPRFRFVIHLYFLRELYKASIERFAWPKLYARMILQSSSPLNYRYWAPVRYETVRCIVHA